MRTKLERAHDISSIGTFVLTIIIVALMVTPMLWPPHPPQSSAITPRTQPMIGWFMPSLLAFCLVVAGVLQLLAARMSHVRMPASSARHSEGRIFLGPDSTPQFLVSLISGHTEIQAAKLLDVYIGKWIKLSGNVTHVGKFEYGRSTVMFSSSRQLEPSVIMHFGEAWTERLSVLRLGNKIDVIGRIDHVDELRILLDDCELV